MSLKNSQGEIVYQIPAPYMMDARQAVSHDAQYELASTERGYVLTVEADPAWMDSSERAYPITIDPTLILYGGDYQGSITATSLTEGSSVTGAGGNISEVYRAVGSDTLAFYASYEYDVFRCGAWGKLISSRGSLAAINPLRYRGYYYDTETGFY